MRIALIANPVSGRRRAVGAANQARERFSAAGWEAPLQLTQGAGDATRLAREAAAAGCDAVFACGGDGSLSEVMRGLLDTGVPAGVVPAGTGNDLARAIGLSRDARQAADQLIAGGPAAIDLMEVNAGALWALNVIGIGFDARVCARINRRHRILGGLSAYLIAVAQELVWYRPTEVELCVDGEQWQGRVLLLAIANATSYGAGMRISPTSQIDDGLLDVVVVEHISRIEFLRSFPRVLAGTHLTHPAVRAWRGEAITVRTPQPCPFLADGDLHGETPLTVRVAPGRGRLWLPGVVPSARR